MATKQRSVDSRSPLVEVLLHLTAKHGPCPWDSLRRPNSNATSYMVKLRGAQTWFYGYTLLSCGKKRTLLQKPEFSEPPAITPPEEKQILQKNYFNIQSRLDIIKAQLLKNNLTQIACNHTDNLTRFNRFLTPPGRQGVRKGGEEQ